MKYLPHYIVLIVSAMAIACTPVATTPDTEISFLIDQTDSLTLCPDAAALNIQLGLKNDPWQGIRVTVRGISDKDINAARIITLPKESVWRGNKTMRLAMVRHFTTQLQQCLGKIHNNDTRPRSIIYRVVAVEANRLAAVSATNKYLLIYSNLMENSNVNFYEPRTFSALHNQPQTVERMLETSVKFQKLNCIKVWLLYNPASYADNNKYMSIAGFYQQLFEAHRATVHIANQFSLL